MSKLKRVTAKILTDYENDNVVNLKRKRKPQNTGISQFTLKEIFPLTYNQNLVFNAYGEGKNIVCHGSAGCGKTFILLYLMLNELLYSQEYEKIVIIRSAQPSKDIGFLPGSEKKRCMFTRHLIMEYSLNCLVDQMLMRY